MAKRPQLATLAAGLVFGGFAVAVAAAVAPACDVEGKNWNSSYKEVCDDFCNYRCGFYNKSAGETGTPKNLTVYRITPRNVTGLLNKNTGSAYGDVDFVIMQKNTTQHCLHDPQGHGCETDVEGKDMYGTFVVEVDGQWGPYQECNPADSWDTSDWKCGLDCLEPNKTGCPRHPRHAKNGSARMGTSINCYCDRSYKTAGREAAPSGGWGDFPKDWPPQCSSGDYWPADDHKLCIAGKTYKTLHGWSEASALTMACKECSADTKCSGWALGDDETSVALFEGNTTYVNCSSYKQHQHSVYKYVSRWSGGWNGVGNIGGWWYSLTNDGGECKDGAPLGTDGCTWRLLETKAYKNATCVDAHADAGVEVYGKTCFDTCPQPLNRNTDCYLDCYRNVLLGDASMNITKPPTSIVVDPWVRALHEDDPARGGCPPVQPVVGPYPPPAPSPPASLPEAVIV